MAVSAREPAGGVVGENASADHGIGALEHAIFGVVLISEIEEFAAVPIDDFEAAQMAGRKVMGGRLHATGIMRCPTCFGGLVAPVCFVAGPVADSQEAAVGIGGELEERATRVDKAS